MAARPLCRLVQGSIIIRCCVFASAITSQPEPSTQQPDDEQDEDMAEPEVSTQKSDDEGSLCSLSLQAAASASPKAAGQQLHQRRF